MGNDVYAGRVLLFETPTDHSCLFWSVKGAMQCALSAAELRRLSSDLAREKSAELGEVEDGLMYGHADFIADPNAWGGEPDVALLGMTLGFAAHTVKWHETRREIEHVWNSTGDAGSEKYIVLNWPKGSHYEYFAWQHPDGRVQTTFPLSSESGDVTVDDFMAHMIDAAQSNTIVSVAVGQNVAGKVFVCVFQ